MKPVIIDLANVPVPSTKPYRIEKASYVQKKEMKPHGLNMMKLFSISVFDRSKDKDENKQALELPKPNAKKAKRYKSDKKRSAAQNASVRTLEKKIAKLVKKRKHVDALKMLKDAPQREIMSYTEHDKIQTQIAEGLLYAGRLDSALKLAKDSHDRSGKYIPQAAWVAGLTLWQQDDYKQAANYFEAVGETPYASKDLSSAGYFWAARAYEKAGNTEKQNQALTNATQFKGTFYGILALQSLNALSHAQEGLRDKDYPTAQWTPQGGYRLDPSLINAIIRQESRFNPTARSYVGATGLMQLMPATAKYIAEKKGYARQISKSSLENPAFNMKLGQDYVEYLLTYKGVDGDIMSMLVAYNAGPGNLFKWRKRMGDNNDPLLFIETLPVKETRDYVEHVMANYWVYRLRAGKDIETDMPSLLALSNGTFPKYAQGIQDAPYKVASN